MTACGRPLCQSRDGRPQGIEWSKHYPKLIQFSPHFVLQSRRPPPSRPAHRPGGFHPQGIDHGCDPNHYPFVRLMKKWTLSFSTSPCLSLLMVSVWSSMTLPLILSASVSRSSCFFRLTISAVRASTGGQFQGQAEGGLPPSPCLSAGLGVTTHTWLVSWAVGGRPQGVEAMR
jgi:hypothetical protein